MCITNYVFIIFITNKAPVNDYNFLVGNLEETPVRAISYHSPSLFATKFKFLNMLWIQKVSWTDFDCTHFNRKDGFAELSLHKF